MRIGWGDLPQEVRDKAEAVIGGGPVVEARSQTGGFSPGTADRVRTATGRRAFVKAVSVGLNAESVRLARQELSIAAVLPQGAPVPRLLGGADDGEWVLLVFEDVEGRHPRTPWVVAEIDAALAALTQVADLLTPPPVCEVPTAVGSFAEEFTGWCRLAAAPPPDLDPWALDHLDLLAGLATQGLEALSGGGTLAHTDIRADNMILRPDGTVAVVDWPWACVGPAWLDRLCLAVNVIVHGGDHERVLTGIDPGVARGFIAGLTGRFQYASRLPPAAKLSAVRTYQRQQGDALLRWLAQ